MPTFPGPFNPEALGDHRAVIEALNSTGYNREALVRLGLVGRDVVPMNRAIARGGGEAHGDLSVMIRLWLTTEPIPEARLRAALGGTVDRFVACGLLARQGDLLRATACLLPVQNRWTLRDYDPREVGGEMRVDHVPSVSLSTALVANFTVRTPAKLGLDMGCGSGYQAMRLSDHCERVIATDINDRCLNFAEMTMAINGITNVELRRGSLFEPIEGLRFDSIASNPPFVISPGSELIFRDSGLPGDQVSERLVRRFADILDEGGWATILFNWHHKDDGTWAERPQEWVSGKGCDVWLVRLRTDSPEEYARAWILTGQGGVGEPDPVKMREWVAYYQSIGAEAMSLAAMVIRKRSAGPANWFRLDIPKPQDEMDSASDQILRVFAAETALRGNAGDAAVLRLKLKLASAVRLEQTLKPERGAWMPASSRITANDGLSLQSAVAPQVASFLARHDGTRTAGELAREAAAGWGTTPEQAERSVVPVLARLMREGYLEIV
jgi:SAM-dependent methyltransferase